MKRSHDYILPILLSVLFSSCSQKGTNENESTDQRSFQQIHEEAVVIDGHNDFLYMVVDEVFHNYLDSQPIKYSADLKGISHIDLNRQIDGGLDVQFFSIWCPGSQADPFEMAMRQIDSLEVIALRNAGRMALAKDNDELLAALSEKKSIAMMGMEGGHMIEDDLNKLVTLYRRGVRYMTLTWNNSTSWATSSYDEQTEVNFSRKGLNDFGIQVVNKMNELGMLVDISHVGEQTFWDVMEVTTKPVIASHSSVYSICKWHRNLKDDQIKAIAQNEGVVMVNFYPGYIDSTFWESEAAFFERHKEESDSLMKVFEDNEWMVEYHLYHKYAEEANSMRPSLTKLIDHIDYIVKLVGIDYAGLGSDFDGITISPKQLDDVTDFPLITKEFIERGYSEGDVKKILGGNFLRVLKANSN